MKYSINGKPASKKEVLMAHFRSAPNECLEEASRKLTSAHRWDGCLATEYTRYFVENKRVISGISVRY